MEDSQEMHKESFKKCSAVECLKIRSLVVFNSGGIELFVQDSNISTEKARSRVKQNMSKASERNIIISVENLSSLPYINEREMFFYYGETLENQRHGWGFLADKNNIIYEGMWYKDQAVGLYILQRNFLVEFGYKDYFYREPNSYRSQIFSGKETEIILDNKILKSGMHGEYFSCQDLSETSISDIAVESCPLSGLKQQGLSVNDNVTLVGQIRKSNFYRSLYGEINRNAFAVNSHGARLPKNIYAQKDRNQGFSRKVLGELINYNKCDYFRDSEYLTLRADKCLNLSNGHAEDGYCVSCKALISKRFNSAPIYACDCNKWSNETISLILISSGLLEEAMILESCKITGSDIPNLNDQFIKELGVSDVYSRKFISRLFQHFWGFIDYMDLSLVENLNIRKQSTLPYIHFSQVDLESYVSGNSQCIVLCGSYKAQKVICKTLIFNAGNYEELNSNHNVKYRNTTNDILEYTFGEGSTRDENKDSTNMQHFPACYVYKYRQDSVSRENISKYTPTPVKMRNWEGRVLRYLGPHPNIVECIGATQLFEGYEALLLENCEGGSMDQYLLKGNATEFQRFRSECSASRLEMLSWLRDVAAGMHHVHQSGILHRDLKLSNFFISKFAGKSVGKVGDFGIAISIDPKLGYSPLTDFGNVYYAAPEVLRKEGFFKESDVWSFGMCMLEVLTKSLVFDGFCPGLAMVVNAASIQAVHKGLHMPAELNALLASILHPDKEMRPSFESISVELSKIIESSQRSALQKLFEFHAFR